MKKLFLSLLTIGVVSAVAIGATRAYFTDTESVLGNTISTGTINIKDNSAAWMTVTFNNVKPGDTVRKWVVMQNIGSLNVGSLTVSAVNAQGDTDLLDNIKVSLYGTVDTFAQGIYSPDWGNGQIVSTWLQNVNILGTAVYNDAAAGHVLAPLANDTVIFDFHIPTTLGNDFQGKSVTFDLQFNAEQVH